AYEADGADQRVREEGIDGFFVAVEDVEDACGDAGVDEHLAQEVGREGDALGGFEDEGVAAGDGDGEHPERDHGGEIEGGDAGADADGMARCFAVDIAGDVGEGRAHEEAGDAAGELNDFYAALD